MDMESPKQVVPVVWEQPGGQNYGLHYNNDRPNLDASYQPDESKVNSTQGESGPGVDKAGSFTNPYKLVVDDVSDSLPSLGRYGNTAKTVFRVKYPSADMHSLTFFQVTDYGDYNTLNILAGTNMLVRRTGPQPLGVVTTIVRGRDGHEQNVMVVPYANADPTREIYPALVLYLIPVGAVSDYQPEYYAEAFFPPDDKGIQKRAFGGYIDGSFGSKPGRDAFISKMESGDESRILFDGDFGQKTKPSWTQLELNKRVRNLPEGYIPNLSSLYPYEHPQPGQTIIAKGSEKPNQSMTRHKTTGRESFVPDPRYSTKPMKPIRGLI